MYNHEKKYEKKIKVLMDQVEELCLMGGIPFMATFAVSDNGKETKYENYLVSGVDTGLSLTDDHLIEHANVFNGFKTTLNKQGEDMTFYDDMFNVPIG